jgi:hypothetical protein
LYILLGIPALRRLSRWIASEVSLVYTASSRLGYPVSKNQAGKADLGKRLIYIR